VIQKVTSIEQTKDGDNDSKKGQEKVTVKAKHTIIKHQEDYRQRRSSVNRQMRNNVSYNKHKTKNSKSTRILQDINTGKTGGYEGWRPEAAKITTKKFFLSCTVSPARPAGYRAGSCGRSADYRPFLAGRTAVYRPAWPVAGVISGPISQLVAAESSVYSRLRPIIKNRNHG